METCASNCLPAMYAQLIRRTERHQLLEECVYSRRHARSHPLTTCADRRAHILPGFGISAVLFSGFIAWDQLTQPHRIESLRTAQQETQARKAHIRELMEEYKLIGKKKED